MKSVIFASAASLLLVGCGAGQYADRINVSKLPEDEQRAALAIKVYDQATGAPQYSEIVNEVQAISCQNKVWDAPATKADALRQLRVKALRLGANAIVSVTYTNSGTSYKPNCWESVTVSGTAVRL